MELGLDFDDEDFAKAPRSSPSSSSSSSYVPKQCSPEWFVGNNDDVMALKHEADLQFASGQYLNAIASYQSVLDKTGKRSMGVVRDVLEALSRCHLNMQDVDNALLWANKLHQTSNAGNQDHLTISYSLLARVYHCRGEFRHEISCLSGITCNHPFLPDIWIRLGEAYHLLYYYDDNVLVSRAFCCFTRAKTLLANVENTVESFAKDKNVKQQQLIELKMRDMKLIIEREDDVKMEMTRDIFNRQQKKEVEEFQDLGQSAKMKAQEDSYQKIEEVSVSSLEDTLEKLFNEHETKWFSFLSS